MKVIGLRKELFSFIDKQFVECFNNECKSKEIIKENMDFIIDRISNQFIGKLKQINFNELQQSLQVDTFQIKENPNINYRKCLNCSKPIFYQETSNWSNDLYGTQLTNFFCKCKVPKREFSEEIFIFNSKVLVLNGLGKLVLGGDEFFLNVLDIRTRNFQGPLLHNYRLNSLLMDIYGSIDALKFQLLVMNENIYIDERTIKSKFFASNNKRIREIQSCKHSLNELIGCIQDKLNIKENLFLNFANWFDFIDMHKNPDEIMGIVNERNNIAHNYMNISYIDHIIFNKAEKRRVKMVLLLYTNYLLLFYTILLCLGHIVDSDYPSDDE